MLIVMRVEFSGDMKKVADFVEDVEGVEILSIGNSLELVKDLRRCFGCF